MCSTGELDAGTLAFKKNFNGNKYITSTYKYKYKYKYIKMYLSTSTSAKYPISGHEFACSGFWTKLFGNLRSCSHTLIKIIA